MAFVTLGLDETVGRFGPRLHVRGKETEAQRGEGTCPQVTQQCNGRRPRTSQLFLVSRSFAQQILTECQL